MEKGTTTKASTEVDKGNTCVRKSIFQLGILPLSDTDLIPSNDKCIYPPDSKSLDNEHQLPNGLVIDFIRFKHVLQKIVFMIGVSSKAELSHILDSTLSLNLWQNVLLTLPHMIYWTAEFVIVVLVYQLDRVFYL